MAEPSDQQWFDILAGRTNGQGHARSTPGSREAEALRRVILETQASHMAKDHDVETGLQRLLFRLRCEGLTSEPPRTSWRIWRVFGIAATVLLAIGVVMFQSPPDEVAVYRGGGAQPLTVSDTVKTAAALSADLKSLNIAPKVTRFGDNITVEADWPTQPGARHKAFLKRHNLNHPASGPLVIQLTHRPADK